ncbi:glucose/sorbosone dehydrogenase [Lysobacter psychrotolerans]|uniref:Glucose/sorbosone dehydrogenase n=2 Tax=Montanilutibacter psychrotolerans TaxID=1327343 RepID=A0A3M8T4C3_9GAMM|nr:glucose/sorbosone dehydrogenase [Lysobacter psychrotolerans]
MLALALSLIALAGVAGSAPPPVTDATPTRLVPQAIRLDDGRRFTLQLPEGYTISPAAQGLKRVRFFARSPDGRVFVTDMHDLSDNRRGAVHILDGWDAQANRFTRISQYLNGLRNPNSIAFHVDTQGRQWLYLALTDRLVRYRYRDGDTAPRSEAEVLATFPDYGLSYKYGGWHLTRSIAFAGNGKLYVSVGSSCNACIEKESVRASILEMNPDGSGQRVFARGMRNAVGLAVVDDRLLATNQGADHLGRDRPDEALYRVEDGADYGWPYCYPSGRRVLADPKFPRRRGCAGVPRPFATFPAHASALGLAYFAEAPADSDSDVNSAPPGSEIDAPRHQRLAGSYLVALHGSTNRRIGHGYRLVRVGGDGRPLGDFILGFQQASGVVGRPCGILAFGSDAFLLSDDHRGVVYYVRPTLPQATPPPSTSPPSTRPTPSSTGHTATP